MSATNISIMVTQIEQYFLLIALQFYIQVSRKNDLLVPKNRNK